MSDWALWAEAEAAAEPDPDERGDVDESLEARRLSRWLKAMFGGESGGDGRSDEPGRPRA